MPTDNEPPLSNIVGIGNYNPDKHLNSKPNQAVIDKLIELLDWARSGRLKSIANVCVLNDRTVCSGWCGDSDTKDMAYGIHSLAYRFMKAEDERRD